MSRALADQRPICSAVDVDVGIMRSNSKVRSIRAKLSHLNPLLAILDFMNNGSNIFGGSDGHRSIIGTDCYHTLAANCYSSGTLRIWELAKGACSVCILGS